MKRSDQSSGGNPTACAERGALLVTVLIVMIPLLVLVMGATTVMTGRNSTLLRSIQETKALLAAEAGIEEAAQRGQAGTLVPGDLFTRDLGRGMRNAVTAIHLGTDGIDNDGDRFVDEPDERSFEVLSYGYYGQAVRRLSAIVVEPDLPPPLSAAILVLGEPEIRVGGGSVVTGYDTNIDGTRGLPANDVAGIANQPPYDTAGLAADVKQSGSSTLAGDPQLDTTVQQFNLPGLGAAVQNSVDNIVPPGTLNKGDFGNALLGNWQVTYCPGDLQVSGSLVGAGILFVQGDMTVVGSMRFDGLVVAMGDFESGGDAVINGAVIQGPGASLVKTVGGSVVRFSTEALSRIPSILEPGFDISGMREISQW